MYAPWLDWCFIFIVVMTIAALLKHKCSRHAELREEGYFCRKCGAFLAKNNKSPNKDV